MKFEEFKDKFGKPEPVKKLKQIPIPKTATQKDIEGIEEYNKLSDEEKQKVNIEVEKMSKWILDKFSLLPLLLSVQENLTFYEKMSLGSFVMEFSKEFNMNEYSTIMFFKAYRDRIREDFIADLKGITNEIS